MLSMEPGATAPGVIRLIISDISRQGLTLVVLYIRYRINDVLFRP